MERPSNDNHKKISDPKLAEALAKLGARVEEREAKIESEEISKQPEMSAFDIAQDLWSQAEAKAINLGEGNRKDTIYNIARTYADSFHTRDARSSAENDEMKRTIHRNLDNIYAHENSSR